MNIVVGIKQFSFGCEIYVDIILKTIFMEKGVTWFSNGFHNLPLNCKFVI